MKETKSAFWKNQLNRRQPRQVTKEIALEMVMDFTPEKEKKSPYVVILTKK